VINKLEDITLHRPSDSDGVNQALDGGEYLNIGSSLAREYRTSDESHIHIIRLLLHVDTKPKNQ